LRTIARALSKTRWDLPAPDKVDEEGAVYGHPECVCESALNEVAHCGEENVACARTLLQPLPGNGVIKKMCYITTLGRIYTGYELAAVKGPERRVAIIGKAGVSENEAESLLRRGYSCLFVRTKQTDP
jgi:hypothetical protein